MNTFSSHDTKVQKALAELEEIRNSEIQKAKLRLQEVYYLDPEIKSIDEALSSTGYHAINTYLAKGKDLSKEDLIAALKEHNLSLRQKREEKLKNLGFPADYTAVRYQCPDCQDTGFTEGKRCHCLNQKLIRLSYSSSNLEKAISSQNFDTFDLNRFSREPFKNRKLSPYQNTSAALRYLKAFCEQFPNVDPKNIYFYGAPGTGKTFMASCIAKALLDRGFSVLYMMCDDLVETLEKKRMGKGNTDKIDTLSEQIEEADLLIIDDLGCEFKTQLSTSLLLGLINSRMVEKKATVISTNLTVADLKKEYSERLSSRIMGSYQVIELFGQDQRQIQS